MNADQINAFNGCCVEVNVDGEPALGILFCRENVVSISTLCFVKSTMTCPLLTHDLTAAEIDSLKPIDRKRLASAIALNSRRTGRLGASEVSEGKVSRQAF